jgi:hypothetical protein
VLSLIIMGCGQNSQLGMQSLVRKEKITDAYTFGKMIEESKLLTQINMATYKRESSLPMGKSDSSKGYS